MSAASEGVRAFGNWQQSRFHVSGAGISCSSAKYVDGLHISEDIVNEALSVPTTSMTAVPNSREQQSQRLGTGFPTGWEHYSHAVGNNPGKVLHGSQEVYAYGMTCYPMF